MIKSDVTGDYLTQTEKSALPQRQGRCGNAKTLRSDDCGADYRAPLGRVNGSIRTGGGFPKCHTIMELCTWYLGYLPEMDWTVINECFPD